MGQRQSKDDTDWARYVRHARSTHVVFRCAFRWFVALGAAVGVLLDLLHYLCFFASGLGSTYVRSDLGLGMLRCLCRFCPKKNPQSTFGPHGMVSMFSTSMSLNSIVAATNDGVCLPPRRQQMKHTRPVLPPQRFRLRGQGRLSLLHQNAERNRNRGHKGLPAAAAASVGARLRRRFPMMLLRGVDCGVEVEHLLHVAGFLLKKIEKK